MFTVGHWIPVVAWICNATLEKLKKLLVVHAIEERMDVRVENPVHLPGSDVSTKHTQRIMAGSSWAESEGTGTKVLFIDSFQDHHQRSLDDFILHARKSQTSHFALSLQNVAVQAGARAIAATVEPVAADRRRSIERQVSAARLIR